MMKRIFAGVLAAIALTGSLVANAGPVNINTADAATLAAELTGIGPALARAIVDERDKNGRFERPEDLTRVSGIGMNVIETNREFILVDSPG
jgi:competence protein ComEA